MHEHQTCNHDFKYCQQCDVVYCEICKGEWRKIFFSTYPKVWYETSSSNPDLGTYTVNYRGHNHNE